MTLQKQLLFLFICFFSYTVTGQSKPKLPAQDSLPPFTKNYPSINEDDLIDTRWQYIYATYTGSRTKVFPADENYNHYIWLKFDYTFEQYLNGQRTFGMWTLNDKRNQIYYKFKNTKWWEIVRFTKDTLILEFVDNYAS
jgi:hypothetical protein